MAPMVVVEARDTNDPNQRVRYYGASEPFAIAPGRHVTVAVPLELQLPAAEIHVADAPLVLLFDGVERQRVNDIGSATVRLRSIGADKVVLANDASFSAGLRRLDLAHGVDGERVTCVTQADAEGLEWRICDVGGWDLATGLPPLGDGAYSVYAKLVDARGYESAVHKATVTLDTEPPALMGAAYFERDDGAVRARLGPSEVFGTEWDGVAWSVAAYPHQGPPEGLGSLAYDRDRGVVVLGFA